MQAQGSANYLQRHPEEIGPLMDLVATLELAALKSCGESSEAADQALLLIARPARRHTAVTNSPG